MSANARPGGVDGRVPVRSSSVLSGTWKAGFPCLRMRTFRCARACGELLFMPLNAQRFFCSPIGYPFVLKK